MEKSQSNKLARTQDKDSKALILTTENENDIAPRVKADVQMLLPGGSRLAKIEIDNSIPAPKNEKFMGTFGELILATRKDANWNTPFEFGMIQEAMKRMKPPPSPVEVYLAFWDAFGDKYTPATGVEWKNICSRIEERREQYYTPPEEPETKQEYLEKKVKRLKRENDN